MAVFIELVTEPFDDTFTKSQKNLLNARRAGTASARRPLRGLEIKDDTYALLRVVDAAGTPVPLFDSSRPETGYDGEYTNFLLQAVQEARMEKSQIVETFGESYIYFFGESPRFLDVSVTLLNTNDFNWEAEWWANYENYFRGSRLTELGARLYMFYDDNIVEGYMLQAQAAKTSAEPLSVQMTFRLFVTNYSNVSFIGSTDFPIRGGVDLSRISLNNTATTLQLNPVDLAHTALQQLASSGFGGSGLLAEALRRGLVAGQGGIATGPLSPPPGTATTRTVESQLGEFANNAGNRILGAAESLFKGKPPVRTLPLRGAIRDNKDEWTGPQGAANRARAAKGLFEVGDLALDGLKMLGAYGVSELSPKTLSSLGLSPRFQDRARNFLQDKQSSYATFGPIPPQGRSGPYPAVPAGGDPESGLVPNMGATQQVGGQPSAFALESLPGDVYAAGASFEYNDGTINTTTYTKTPGEAAVVHRTTTQK